LHGAARRPGTAQALTLHAHADEDAHLQRNGDQRAPSRHGQVVAQPHGDRVSAAPLLRHRRGFSAQDLMTTPSRKDYAVWRCFARAGEIISAWQPRGGGALVSGG